MKLDRNITLDGRGKYAILLLRRFSELYQPSELFAETEVTKAIELLDNEGLIDWGETETEHEFFVIRLRDKYAATALAAYATVAQADDPEYAGEIMEMAKRSGPLSPFVKGPD